MISSLICFGLLSLGSFILDVFIRPKILVVLFLTFIFGIMLMINYLFGLKAKKLYPFIYILAANFINAIIFLVSIFIVLNFLPNEKELKINNINYVVLNFNQNMESYYQVKFIFYLDNNIKEIRWN